jgi:hypothetical protein
MVERSEAMPIRGSPDGAHHPRPQCGRDRPEWVVAINRNGWSQTIVTAGRDHPVRAKLSSFIGKLVFCGRLSVNSHDKTFLNKLIKNLPFICI